MRDILKNVIDYGKEISLTKWTVQDATTKLFEEGGELSEAAMIKIGKLPHKQPKTPDDDFEETADVIVCSLDVLLRLNPDMPTEDILDKLETMLRYKTNKWKRNWDKFK